MKSDSPIGPPEKLPFAWNPRVRKARTPAADFWQRVSDGLELEALWAQFRAEARASYGLYSQEVDWKTLEQEKGIRRAAKIAQAFFWALISKLTPARRILLLLSLLLILFGRIHVVGGDVDFIFPLSAYGVAGLVLLLAMELADRVTMKRDLEIAREIQRWLVPEKPPQVDGADIAFTTRPANTVAGDYYDAFLRRAPDKDSQNLLVTVADVAGKSVPAALLMATLQASLQALAATADSLHELVTGLNRYACEHSLGGMRFTTGFFAELNSAQRTLTYINAGHNAPLLLRADGRVERLELGGLPLGIQSDAGYQMGQIGLHPGDVLFIFTDGLVEALNEQGEEFGEERLLQALAESPARSASEMLAFVLERVEHFEGAKRQHDDITCLVLKAI
jgi:sigma-B regulation protein RsbU (phosphoserine phosphatase)